MSHLLPPSCKAHRGLPALCSVAAQGGSLRRLLRKPLARWCSRQLMSCQPMHVELAVLDADFGTVTFLRTNRWQESAQYARAAYAML